MGSRWIWILPALVLMLGVSVIVPISAGDVHSSPYVWAKACKGCHEEIYRAWGKTKHKVALHRLSDKQQRDRCVKCHVTGFDKVVYQGDVELNGGVQCEVCHGPALSHVAAAENDLLPLSGPMKLPSKDVCVRCHCTDSPHYQWFDYKTMRKFVHSLD